VTPTIFQERTAAPVHAVVMRGLMYGVDAWKTTARLRRGAIRRRVVP
jgi:hypothetical protein